MFGKNGIVEEFKLFKQLEGEFKLFQTIFLFYFLFFNVMDVCVNYSSIFFYYYFFTMIYFLNFEKK